jgi:2-polyprenyl-6-methoxyphenol hydroxylase-like FAD-dependent oxidoreductase
MLGLYHLGSRILHGLGLFEAYMARSVTMRIYNICNGHGNVVHNYDLTELTQRYGPLQGISRSALIKLLLEGTNNLPIRMGTTVKTLNQSGDTIKVTFDDETTAEFDLVVAADGMHSDTRKMILDGEDYAYRDTGWGGWVFWTDSNLAPQDAYTEYWGAGRFLGLYPVKDRLGVFLGGSVSHTKELGLVKFAKEMREQFKPEARVPTAILESVEPTDDSFFWNFHDCRSKHWRKGRVVLLGDAATGFLPTAGVGASMAMESAAALNDELSRTNTTFIEQALDLYEKRHRKRVEDAQESSRQMGNMMFIDSLPLAWGRDQLVKFYTIEMLIKSIGTMMDDPI